MVENDINAFGRYKTCPQCNKKFYVGVTITNYSYITISSNRKKCFCSYHCMQAFIKNKKIEKEKRRLKKWQTSKVD